MRTRAKKFYVSYTVPGPGEPGYETWLGKDGKPNDSWKHGGAPIWVTGSYDPDTNLTYWGTGNAGPDWDGDARLGDNLYSSSVIALDADTGKLKWYYQFSPHNEFDWDATQVPVLADIQFKGQPRKTMSGQSQRHVLRAGPHHWSSLLRKPSPRPTGPMASMRKAGRG